MRGTVLDRVRSLVTRLTPEPVCDDCIAERLDLTVREHANRKTRALAGTAGLEKQIGECALCGGTKNVIRYRGR